MYIPMSMAFVLKNLVSCLQKLSIAERRAENDDFPACENPKASVQETVHLPLFSEISSAWTCVPVDVDALQGSAL